MSRALGSESSWLLSKLVCTRVAVVSMAGDSPVTVTSSSIAFTDELGVHGGREADADADVVADDRAEARPCSKLSR